MPLPVGSIRPSAALAAMAASIAVPPCFITSSAICVASGCEVAAIACGAITSERVAKARPVMRSAASADVPAAAVSAAARDSEARMRMMSGTWREARAFDRRSYALRPGGRIGLPGAQHFGERVAVFLGPVG